MDEVAKYNQARWKALAEADALFTRPALNLNSINAREKVDSAGMLGQISGKDVLCLAGGGGQQSAAFALLGASVTVLDLSAEQLIRDNQAAEFYQTRVKTFQGDMRNLSILGNLRFDIVYHAYSLNFVPDAVKVFREVAQILRTGGIYHFKCANPYLIGIEKRDWKESGYLLKHPYLSGAEISYEDQEWVYNQSANEPILKPKEYRHSLSILINGLTNLGFIIKHFSDSLDIHPDENAEPATWDHLAAYAPPWLDFWTVYQPN